MSEILCTQAKKKDMWGKRAIFFAPVVTLIGPIKQIKPASTSFYAAFAGGKRRVIIVKAIQYMLYFNKVKVSPV